MSDTIRLLREMHERTLQRITEISHLKEIILELVTNIETQVITNTMNREEMFKALRKARNSIQ